MHSREIFVTLLIAVSGQLAAIAGEVKTVVVGYHPAAGLMYGAKDGERKSGYAYDYIQEMANHTGWRYRYVYGGFNELYEKLKTGEIDVLPYVTRTARRERDVAFPSQPMGENRLYLAAVKPGRIGDDLKELQGRRIGLLRGSYSSLVLRKYLAENGIGCDFVEYDLGEDRVAAIKKGEIDYVVETSMARHHGEICIVRELDMPHQIYLAVSKTRPDLLAELNAAQKESEELNPGFLGTLRWKHFKGNTVHREIGSAARKWFAEHRTLRIGTYRGDAFWIRRNEDGSFCGVLADYVDALMKSLDLAVAVEWKFYDGRENALGALKTGEIDLLNPYYCAYGDAEADGVLISDQALTCNFSVLHLGDYTRNTMAVVATPSTRLGARYLRDNYPKARIVPCQNGPECIEALLAGRANSVVMNSEGLRQLAGRYNRNFSIRPLNADCPIAFAALPRNKALVSVINRAIPLMSEVEVNALFDKYGADDSTRITARQFFARHPEYIGLAIAALLIVVLVIHVLRMRASRDRLEADMANRTLAFTNYFMDTFESSYLVNLKTREFNPYAREDRIEREYPTIPDYLESITTYAEREVVPEDRKDFLEFVQPENLKKLLKERPVVSLSFRVKVSGVGKVYGLRVVRGADENSAAFAFADVTEETRREQEHQRQMAMAEARTRFFFNVSHDVRTPIHAIMGLVDMCLDEVRGERVRGESAKVSGEGLARVQDYLLKMKASGGLLLAIIKSVLDMSRIEAGKVKLEETCGDVYLSFLEIEPTLRELADEKQVALSFDFGEIRDRYVYADYEKCSRVFVNIITNAIKYTNPGGWVKVRCEQVGEKVERLKVERLKGSGDDDSSTVQPFNYSTYRYTFEDNGIGMSDEFQTKLYEKFAREKNTTASGVGGLGLGMAIAKSFVDILGGTIECRSKPGEGTVFTVTLPFRVQEGRKWIDPMTGAVRDADVERNEKSRAGDEELRNSRISQNSQAPRTFKGKRALLVDDTKMSRLVALHYLTKAGLEVDVAVNGQEAVEKVTGKCLNEGMSECLNGTAESPSSDSENKIIRQSDNRTIRQSYDIILMDLQMPVMDGIEATKAIRTWEAGRSHIPVVAWTANAFDEDVQRALDAGMDGHIAKAGKSAALVETLARFLGEDWNIATPAVK